MLTNGHEESSFLSSLDIPEGWEQAFGACTDVGLAQIMKYLQMKHLIFPFGPFNNQLQCLISSKSRKGRHAAEELQPVRRVVSALRGQNSPQR